VPRGQSGAVAIKLPLPPGCFPTLYGDDETFQSAYLSRYPGYYLTGDGGFSDEDGYLSIMGRIDDVINVSGHRLGTAEVESALVSHEAVTEAAVVARPDELKGSAIVAFVTLEGSHSPSDKLNACCLNVGYLNHSNITYLWCKSKSPSLRTAFLTQSVVIIET